MCKGRLDVVLRDMVRWVMVVVGQWLDQRILEAFFPLPTLIILGFLRGWGVLTVSRRS